VDPGALLEDLDDEQRVAVTSDAAPLRILAGAGSGKTRVLTRRIAWRAATDDLDPRRVLVLTFTRRAAGELSQRLRALGLRDAVAAGTFHAVAYAQLRRRWAEQGVTPPTLIERKAPVVASLLPRDTPRGHVVDLIAELEWAAARQVGAEGYPAAATAAGRRPPLPPDQVADLLARYSREKRRRRLVDFDDLLRLCRRDLLADADFAARQRWRFRHLFVDEFQDVNPLQHALLSAWLGDRRDLCVVGDPNQAIYAWNGADNRFLAEFDRYHPGGATVVLSRNYRSAPQILHLAHRVLDPGDRRRGSGPPRAVRPDGPVPRLRGLPDDRAEARAIARAARDEHGPGRRWADQAVLVRTNAQLALIEEALSDARIPFRVRGGSSLLDQPDVRDALRALARRSAPLAEALVDLESTARELEATAGDGGAERAAALDTVVRLGRDHLAVDPAASMADFVAGLAATLRGDQLDGGGDAVELATFHAAKGLEWPVVHVAGVEQGLVPVAHARTAAAQAEERRLLHVALTRAERVLRITWALERTFGSRTLPRSPSPWIEDLLAACAELEGGPACPPAPRRGDDRRPARRPARSTPGPPTPTDLDPGARRAFEALRAWRTRLARAADVPAYVIAHDRTLAALAAAGPRTREELLEVPGLGEVKVSRYGDELLELLAEHAPG
jgi:DNA helicase-2/ATP-dependent DNA helicase PcrA